MNSPPHDCKAGHRSLTAASLEAGAPRSKLFDRLMARGLPNCPPVSVGAVVERLKTKSADDFARFAASFEDDEAAPPPSTSTRARLPDLAQVIANARKAGEVGPLTVSATLANGVTVSLTSGAPEKSTQNPWDEVSRATH